MTSSDENPPDDESRRRAARDLEEAFAQLAGEFRRVYTQAATTASPGMLPGTYKTLSVIARVGPIAQSSLADRLAADKGLISRQVTELEGLGMIARTAAEDDGRVRMVEITAFGRKRLEAAREPYQAMLVQTLRDWPLSSIDRLTALVRSLASGAVPDSADVFGDADEAS